MQICFVISNWHLQNTAQVKIVRRLAEETKKEHDVIITSNPFSLFKTLPDVVVSNGYKMSVLVSLINWIVESKHIVLISETPERIPFWWRLLRNKKVFVTSEYIKNKLGYGEVVRIGL